MGRAKKSDEDRLCETVGVRVRRCERLAIERAAGGRRGRGVSRWCRAVLLRAAVVAVEGSVEDGGSEE